MTIFIHTVDKGYWRVLYDNYTRAFNSEGEARRFFTTAKRGATLLSPMGSVVETRDAGKWKIRALQQLSPHAAKSQAGKWVWITYALGGESKSRQSFNAMKNDSDKKELELINPEDKVVARWSKQ